MASKLAPKRIGVETGLLASQAALAEVTCLLTEIRCPGRNSQRSDRSFREQGCRLSHTMLAMPSQIEIYEEMTALSARMVGAAQTNDWDNLIALEKSVVALRQTLMADDNSRLADSEIELKRALIQRILDDDAEIRRHTEPWMEQVRQYLGGGARRKQVERAYGATA